jgi:2',3'-cyclic-nucleotide 2'-phosphodiesterase
MDSVVNNPYINILFIADIIGKPGLKIIKSSLSTIREKFSIDVCIANGENGAAGKGLTQEIANEYFRNGIDVITSGNHIFENYKIHQQLEVNRKILRPLNYPKGVRGKGSLIYQLEDKLKIGIINIQGRTFMFNIDCPFRTISDEIEKIKDITPVIFVDFHAEATAEKIAMGWYLDGKVSAVIGTHTHVQTNDEQILPQGTAFITDVGMTGPFNSVIGMKKEIAIKRFLYQTPMRYQPADSDLKFSGLVVTVNSQTGQAKTVKKLYFSANNEGEIADYER